MQLLGTSVPAHLTQNNTLQTAPHLYVTYHVPRLSKPLAQCLLPLLRLTNL